AEAARDRYPSTRATRTRSQKLPLRSDGSHRRRRRPRLCGGPGLGPGRVIAFGQWRDPRDLVGWRRRSAAPVAAGPAFDASRGANPRGRRQPGGTLVTVTPSSYENDPGGLDDSTQLRREPLRPATMSGRGSLTEFVHSWGCDTVTDRLLSAPRDE